MVFKARDILSHECHGAWRGIRIQRGVLKTGIFCHMSAMARGGTLGSSGGILKPGIFCHMSAMARGGALGSNGCILKPGIF